MEVYFEEVEIGPHFITFYTKNKKVTRFCEGIWLAFSKKYPGYASINNEKFVHIEEDPKVYHRFGEPDNFRDAWSHFHIKTETRPDLKWVAEVIGFMKNRGASFDDIVKITDHESFKLNPNDTYPPRKLNESYTDYIKRLKEE